MALKRFFPSLSDDDASAFIYSFFPFLFGVYPYTTVTEKQKRAMENVGFEYGKYSIYDLVKQAVDETNKSLPTFKHILGFEIRKTEFEKTTTKKIKRFLIK